ncbi:MAG TPA: hypothetical protein VEW25_01655, partial [Allosphingosinicella sp.]|nr:hypothetical protein [Allosphingosinicella sp.]
GPRQSTTLMGLSDLFLVAGRAGHADIVVAAQIDLVVGILLGILIDLEIDEEAEENPDDEVDLGGDDDIGVPAPGDEEEV